jgi:hypothetical protein
MPKLFNKCLTLREITPIGKPSSELMVEIAGGILKVTKNNDLFPLELSKEKLF